MTDVLTPAKKLTQQGIGSHPNDWGNVLNTTIGYIDMALGGTLVKKLTGNATLSTTEARNTGYQFSGSLDNPAIVTFPSFSGLGVIQNNTNVALTCGVSGGQSVVVPSTNISAIWSDGTDFKVLTGLGGGAGSVPTGAYLPLSGGTMSGPLNFTTTGSTTSRSAQDRANDWVNVKDFGARLDGTANVDGPAIAAALTSLQSNESLYFPVGNANFSWGSVQGTKPTTPVLFRMDGTISGGARMNRAFNRNNKGDMFETYYNGGKFLSVMSAMPDQPPILHLEYASQAVGSPGSVHLPIFIQCSDNVNAVTSMWGLGVSMSSYANVNDPANWPQQVGVSSSLLKYGKAWCAGIHITAQDNQNVASSVGGTLVGMEIGHHVNGNDDGNASGSPGLRYGIHLSQSEVTGSASSGGLIPAVFAMGYQLDGTNNAVTKTCFGVTGAQTYQVFDARTATAPPGYTDPVAALRMDPGQIIDFNGANTVLNSPGWTGAAGNYLQYTTTGAARLRYMVGTTEVWSIANTGLLTSVGMSFGSIVDTAASSTAKHIQLYGTTYGIGITSGRINYVVPAANSHVFLNGTTDTVTITSTGLTALQFSNGTGGPTWTSGSAVPTSTQPKGSLYTRTGGAVGSTLYVSQGAGTWNAVAGV